MLDKIDRQTIFNRASNAAQAALKEVIAAENQNENDLAFSLTQSPLKPWVIAEADSLLIYTVSKTGCLLGGWASGTGILIHRLATSDDTLIKWSAPIFLTLKLGCVGLSVGRTTCHTFAVGIARTARDEILKGHVISGLDFNVECGAKIVEKSDVISVNFSSADLCTVGVSKVSGAMFDFSFTSGSMKVDMEKHTAVYGDLTPLQVLIGAIDTPAEMQPLYSELSLMVHDCERPTASPGRVSASLERFSTGYDPDSVVVLSDGNVATAT